MMFYDEADKLWFIDGSFIIHLFAVMARGINLHIYLNLKIGESAPSNDNGHCGVAKWISGSGGILSRQIRQYVPLQPLQLKIVCCWRLACRRAIGKSGRFADIACFCTLTPLYITYRH